MPSLQYNLYNFSVGPPEFMDEPTDQPKELLRVLIRWFPEFNLDRKKTVLVAWK